jgi:hypothetical protein
MNKLFDCLLSCSEKNITSFTLYFGKFLKQEHENTEVMRYVDKIILHPQYLPLLDEVIKFIVILNSYSLFLRFFIL